MVGVLALLFLLVPIAELYVIEQVSHSVGVTDTILLLVGISVAGAWLAKMAGIGVINRLRRTVMQGRVPSGELVDGALVLLAGALMISPGFISDVVAVLLLLPPTRALARGAVLRRIRAGGGLVNVVAGRRHGPAGAPAAQVWDVEGWEDPPMPPERPGLDR
jgi:UPF0716 protein FxsA